MADQYDLIVLGSGPGGYVAAIRAAQLGLKTAIVERELLGGICLNWGCIPTKALLRSAEIYHYLQHADAYGLSNEKPSFDLAKVVARSRAVAKQLNQGVTHLMKKNKIAVVMGEGKLTGKGKLSVAGADGKATDLQIQTCENRGCYAGAPITPDVLAALRSGKELKLSFQNLAKETITIPMPLTDFAAAYDKIK